MPPDGVNALIVPGNQNAGVSGCFAGAVQNALRYKIMVVPNRGANVVNIINKTVLNARGKPTSWIRFSPGRGTGKFANPHISVDKAFTG